MGNNSITATYSGGTGFTGVKCSGAGGECGGSGGGDVNMGGSECGNGDDERDDAGNGYGESGFRARRIRREA